MKIIEIKEFAVFGIDKTDRFKFDRTVKTLTITESASKDFI